MLKTTRQQSFFFFFVGALLIRLITFVPEKKDFAGLCHKLLHRFYKHCNVTDGADHLSLYLICCLRRCYTPKEFLWAVPFLTRCLVYKQKANSNLWQSVMLCFLWSMRGSGIFCLKWMNLSSVKWVQQIVSQSTFLDYTHNCVLYYFVQTVDAFQP